MRRLIFSPRRRAIGDHAGSTIATTITRSFFIRAELSRPRSYMAIAYRYFPAIALICAMGIAEAVSICT